MFISRLRSHLSYANLVATLAMFIALGGGAYAARGLVFGGRGVLSECISKQGAVRAIATGGHCKRGEQLVAINVRGVPGPAGAPGARGEAGGVGVSGAAGQQGGSGSPGSQGIEGSQGIQGIQGVAGTARAFGLVSSSGALSRQSSVVSVARVSPGTYCITLASGITPSATGLNLTANANDAPQNPFVTFAPLGGQCESGQLEVITARYTGASYIATDVSFFFSVP